MAKTFWQVIRQNWLVLILLLGILILGNNLRSYSYASVPHPGENTDEYCYGWLGLSLIKDKYPSSWSSLSSLYPNREFKKINIDQLFDADPHRPAFPIVKPWFDNPPLFGLITGGYAYFKGVRDFSDAGVAILRRPMLRIAVLTTVLIFILGTQLFDKKVGLLSAFLYSIIPSVLISSRVAIIENGYIPLFLGSLILANLYFKKKKMKYWIVATFLASIAILFKLSAVSVELTLILLAFLYGKKERKKLVLINLLGIVSPLILFCLFGAYYDWQTFVHIFLTNSKRFYGASSEIFYTAVVLPKITKFFTDGWIILGWISTLGLALLSWKKEKGSTIIVISIFTYLVVFLILGSESYGWYRFPFYPFLIIAMAKVFTYLIKAPNLFVFLALTLLPFGTTIHKLIGVDGFQVYVPYFRLFCVLSLALFSLPIIFGDKKIFVRIQQLYMVAVLSLLSFWSIKEIMFYNYSQWFSVT